MRSLQYFVENRASHRIGTSLCVDSALFDSGSTAADVAESSQKQVKLAAIPALMNSRNIQILRPE
jgi:hypothetical protein